MTTRRELSAARRATHHLRQLREATTDIARLRTACGWLVAEARRGRSLAEATKAVLSLVGHLREGRPLPVSLHEAVLRLDQTSHASVTRIHPTTDRERRAA